MWCVWLRLWGWSCCRFCCSCTASCWHWSDVESLLINGDTQFAGMISPASKTTQKFKKRSEHKLCVYTSVDTMLHVCLLNNKAQNIKPGVSLRRQLYQEMRLVSKIWTSPLVQQWLNLPTILCPSSVLSRTICTFTLVPLTGVSTSSSSFQTLSTDPHKT